MTRLQMTAAGAALLLALGTGTAMAQTSRCAQAKYKAASKKFASKAKCLGAAAAKGQPLDEACMQKAEAVFAQGWAKAEARGDCLTLGDVTDVEAAIDSYVANLVSLLEPPRCCAFPGVCTFATKGDCTTAGGTPGVPFSICEGATGACTTAAPAAGNCCQRPDRCDAGPALDLTFCNAVSGTFSTANCTPQGCTP